MLRTVISEDHINTVYALALELARPVARGLLGASHAEAALWCRTMRTWRCGTLPHDPVVVAEAACTILRCHDDNSLTLAGAPA